MEACATAHHWDRMTAAWIGLTPRQHSTGGKPRLGRITKQGDPYLRWLLVAGAMSAVKNARKHGTTDPWLAERVAHKPTKVAAMALANKNARIAWRPHRSRKRRSRRKPSRR